jgi:hypothetical protein
MIPAVAACVVTKRVAWLGFLLSVASFHGIMISCRPIALPLGFAQVEPVPVILNMPIVAGLKPVLRIWRFFSKPAHLTACFARIGIFEMIHLQRLIVP